MEKWKTQSSYTVNEWYNGKTQFLSKKYYSYSKNEKWKTQFLLINQRTVVEEVKWYFSYLDRGYMKLSIENMKFGQNLEESEQAVETGG